MHYGHSVQSAESLVENINNNETMIEFKNSQAVSGVMSRSEVKDCNLHNTLANGMSLPIQN